VPHDRIYVIRSVATLGYLTSRKKRTHLQFKQAVYNDKFTCIHPPSQYVAYKCSKEVNAL
jgi:hypothetical protein